MEFLTFLYMLPNAYCPFVYNKDDSQIMKHFGAKFLKQSCNAEHNILLRKLIKMKRSIRIFF